MMMPCQASLPRKSSPCKCRSRAMLVFRINFARFLSHRIWPLGGHRCSRDIMGMHCRSLTLACLVREGEIVHPKAIFHVTWRAFLIRYPLFRGVACARSVIKQFFHPSINGAVAATMTLSRACMHLPEAAS